MVDLPDPEPPAIPMSSCGTVMVRAVFQARGGGVVFWVEAVAVVFRCYTAGLSGEILDY